MSDDEHSALERLLADAGRGFDFNDGFADRVMGRLGAERAAQEDVSAALARQTRRVLPLLAAASLVLIALNWRSARGSTESAIAAGLGIHATTTTVSANSSMTGLEGTEAFQ